MTKKRMAKARRESVEPALATRSPQGPPPPPPPGPRLRVTGSCELFLTADMTCPLCRVLVPANTFHKCVRKSE